MKAAKYGLEGLERNTWDRENSTDFKLKYYAMGERTGDIARETRVVIEKRPVGQIR